MASTMSDVATLVASAGTTASPPFARASDSQVWASGSHTVGRASGARSGNPAAAASAAMPDLSFMGVTVTHEPVDVAGLGVVAGREVLDHLGVLERGQDRHAMQGPPRRDGGGLVVGEDDELFGLRRRVPPPRLSAVGCGQRGHDHRRDRADRGDQDHDADDARPQQEALPARATVLASLLDGAGPWRAHRR